MKKVIKNVMLIVLMQVALGASGSNLTPTSDLINKVIDYNNELKTTRAVVKNANGKIIHEEIVNVSNKFQLSLDLYSLQDGLYSIELDQDSEIKITPFVVFSNQVIMDESKSYSIFKPVIYKKGAFVYLSRLSFEKKNLKVKIFDVENNLIYFEQFKEKELLKRIYDFSKMYDKKFKVVLTTEGRTFIHNLRF